MNGSILVYNPSFVSNFSRNFLIKICGILREKTVFPEEVIFDEQQQCTDRSLYFLVEGHCKLYLQRNNQKLLMFGKGDSFGILSFFTGQRRKASVKSINFSDIFYLDRDEFVEELKTHQLDLVNEISLLRNGLWRLDTGLCSIMNSTHWILDAFLVIRTIMWLWIVLLYTLPSTCIWWWSWEKNVRDW